MPDLVEIEILTSVMSSRYGALQAGGRVRTDAAYAAQLVNELKCAKYVQASAALDFTKDDATSIALDEPQAESRTLRLRKRK